MAQQIRSDSLQVQQPPPQQGWATRAKNWAVSAKDFALSHKKMIVVGTVAGGALYAVSTVLASPLNAVANTINSLSGLFRKNAAEAGVRSPNWDARQSRKLPQEPCKPSIAGLLS